MKKLSNEDLSGVYYRHNPTLRGFVEAMLWASLDNNGDPLDANYGPEDIAPATLRRIGGFIAGFHAAVDARFGDRAPPDGPPAHEDGSDLGSKQSGHDLFLTAAHHGCGFWDGDWGSDGDTLTEIVRTIGGDACESVYVGDDGLIYIGGWES